MNHIKLIPTFQRKKSIPKQLKDLELKPLNEQFSKLTTPIISDDDFRPNMMGNFFDMESKKIVSTDAHKLTAINMPKDTFNFIAQKYNKELNENPKGLIFHTLKQMQKEYNDLLKIGVNESTGLQPFDEYVEKRVIEDGKYPNYEAVIPKEFTNEIYVDYTKLYWYAKVLLDAKIIDDATKINSSNENEYQNKKIEYLKDSYTSFINPITHQIILTYTLDGEKQYISFNAEFLCNILKFAIEYKGKTFGKVGISGNNRAMVIEFENGLYSPSDSIGLIMPVMINGFNVIGDIDTHDTYYMYYNLDNNTILSGTKLNNVEDFNTYEIDETIGFKANKESLSIPKIRVEEKVTTEVTSDNSYIDDINIDNKILIVEEKGKPLSTYKNGDKVFWANLSFDKNWKQYVEGEVFIKDDEYSIKRFPQNPNFKKYPLSTFNSNTKVVLKPNNEPNYSDKTIKNNGVKNTQNDSITFITNRIKGLKIALKVARAENKPKIQKRILGLEIAKKMQPKKMNNGGGVEIEDISMSRLLSTFSNEKEIFDGQIVNIGEFQYKIENDIFYIKRPNENWQMFRKIKYDEGGNKISKGAVVFTNYNGSEIMYEPNYDEYFVNDEVFDSMESAKRHIDYMAKSNGVIIDYYNGYDINIYPKLNEYWVNDEIKFNSMEDAKNYIDTGEMENEKYGFGGGLLVGSLVGGYLGYKVGKYNKQTFSSGFQTEKLIGKDIKNKLQGKKTYAGGGGVAETMHFFVVIDKNDKNYNRVGYSIDETITDYKQGNEFEKLYFENNKLPQKYNVKDLIYLQQRDTFTQKDRFGFESDFVLLVEYESLPFPYYYLYDVNKKIVGADGGLSWIKTYLPKDFKFNDSYGEGGEVDTISDEDLLRIKLAVSEAQDRIKANDTESNSGGGLEGITNFVKENPQVLALLEKGGSVGDENYEMLKNKVTELLHHSKELQAVVKKKPKTPAWVISKSSRASTDLSDITHYLEGKL